MDVLIILQELSKDKTLSKRDLSKRIGFSLGKMNYILNAVMDKGLVKVEKFKNSKKKIAYMYILTSKEQTSARRFSATLHVFPGDKSFHLVMFCSVGGL